VAELNKEMVLVCCFGACDVVRRINDGEHWVTAARIQVNECGAFAMPAPANCVHFGQFGVFWRSQPIPGVKLLISMKWNVASAHVLMSFL